MFSIGRRLTLTILVIASAITLEFAFHFHNSRLSKAESHDESQASTDYLSSKTRQTYPYSETYDFSCGSVRGEKLSMFHTLTKVRSAYKSKLTQNGTERRGVAIEVKVEPDENGKPVYARILRIVSPGVPEEMVGRRVKINYGICIRVSAIGEIGIMLGTLINESTNPEIDPIGSEDIHK